MSLSNGLLEYESLHSGVSIAANAIRQSCSINAGFTH